MSRVCDTCAGEGKCVQNFDGETCEEERERREGEGRREREDTVDMEPEEIEWEEMGWIILVQNSFTRFCFVLQEAQGN
jgi:hypothetical protein